MHCVCFRLFIMAIYITTSLPLIAVAQTAEPGELRRTFLIHPFPGKDGDGNTVETIGPITVTVEKTPFRTLYLIDYDYYNGSGTWRGYQTVYVDFLDTDNQSLAHIEFPLDRGHCVYNGHETRHIEGQIDIPPDKISSVRANAGTVSGTQTRC